MYANGLELPANQGLRKLLNKLIKNLIFAMNFDDKVPEHIIEEIFRQKKGKNKSGSVAYGGDALTNTLHVVEPEIKTKIETEADYGTDYEAETEADYGTITQFNAEVDKKIKGIQFQDEEAFFSERKIAVKIADTVWNKLNSRDVRDIIQ